MPDLLNNEADAQKLRESLHQRIDRLASSSLSAADHVLLQLEVEQLRRELDTDFANDEQQGCLSANKVGDAIALHRARHPYRG